MPGKLRGHWQQQSLSTEMKQQRSAKMRTRGHENPHLMWENRTHKSCKKENHVIQLRHCKNCQNRGWLGTGLQESDWFASGVKEVITTSQHIITNCQPNMNRDEGRLSPPPSAIRSPRTAWAGGAIEAQGGTVGQKTPLLIDHTTTLWSTAQSHLVDFLKKLSWKSVKMCTINWKIQYKKTACHSVVSSLCRLY